MQGRGATAILASALVGSVALFAVTALGALRGASLGLVAGSLLFGGVLIILSAASLDTKLAQRTPLAGRWPTREQRSLRGVAATMLLGLAAFLLVAAWRSAGAVEGRLAAGFVGAALGAVAAVLARDALSPRAHPVHGELLLMDETALHDLRRQGTTTLRWDDLERVAFERDWREEDGIPEEHVTTVVRLQGAGGELVVPAQLAAESGLFQRLRAHPHVDAHKLAEALAEKHRGALVVTR